MRHEGGLLWSVLPLNQRIFFGVPKERGTWDGGGGDSL